MMATDTKPKLKTRAADTSAPAKPRTADQIRDDVAKLQTRHDSLPSWEHAKRDALQAKLDADRAELELVELQEMPAPAAVDTAFLERSIPIATIVVTGNHREQHDAASLERLALSLRSQQLQQRIGVRSMGDGRFEVIFGHRRLAAAKLAGWAEIPAKVYSQDLTPAQVEILRSIENFGRKNLTPVEEAVAIARTVEAIELTLISLRAAGYSFNYEREALYEGERPPVEARGTEDSFERVGVVWLAQNKPVLEPAIQLLNQIWTAGGLESYVGQQFSRPAKWVKDHAYVSKIGGRARELLMAGRIDIGHARELAKLGDKAKADQIAGWVARDERGLGGKSVEDTRRHVNDSLKSLKVVPWRLDVAFGQGVEGCTGHACVTCPFNSKTDPDLFGGSITDEPEAGVCTHGACFAAKGKIVDRELARATKKAEPVIKKAVAAAEKAGGAGVANLVTHSTIGHLLPAMVKPTSGVRRLHKELSHLAIRPATMTTEAAAAAGLTQPQADKPSAEAIAQEKLDKSREKWATSLRDTVFELVTEDARAYRFLAMACLWMSELGDAIDRSERYQGGGVDAVRAAVAQHSELVEEAIDCDGAGLGRLAVRLVANAEQLLQWFDGQVYDTTMAPLFVRLAAGWGATVPPEPKLEEFLPKPKAAKAPKVDARAVDNTKTPAAGKLLPKPEQPAGQSLAWDAWAKETAKDCRKLKIDVAEVLPTAFAAGLYTAGCTPAQAAKRYADRPAEIADEVRGESFSDDIALGDGEPVAPDVLEVLRRCDRHPLAIIVSERVDRGIYTRFNNVVELLGGKWNKKAQAHTFPTNPSPLIDAVLATGRIVDRKKAIAFFETPEPLAARVAELAGAQAEHLVLEPSAGTGRLVRAVLEKSMRAQVTAVEIDPNHIDELTGICDDVLAADFLKIDLSGYGPFDRIVANPPFLGRVWFKHVTRMIELLKPGGVIVCILPKTAELSRELQQLLIDTMATIDFEDVPPGTFKEAGTTASTCILKAQKTPAVSDFAEDEPAALVPRDLGLTAVEVEKLDAVATIIKKSKPYATIKSVAHDGRRWVVLGTTQHRGHECWRLGELTAATKDDVGHTMASTSAERGDFHGIGVVDGSDKKQRRRICTRFSGSVIFVRITNTPAAAGAAS